MKLKPKIRPRIYTGIPFVLTDDAILTDDTIITNYIEGMSRYPKVTLKEKERPMLTVMQESDYVIAHLRYNVLFTVTSSSVAVENARIVIDGVEKFTNINGQATFRLRNGTYTYTITKTGYITEIDTVTVASADVGELVSIDEDITDPIQALVDEYKAYVASQGGVHGVSDAALYAEYQAMVTAGEIQNDGTNTKNVRNFGIWGYKLDTDRATHMYGLVKIAGNYPIYEPISGVARPVYNVGGYFEMSTATVAATMVFDLNYNYSPFYIDINGHIQHVDAAGDFLADSDRTILRVRTWTGHAARLIVPGPEASSGVLFLNNFQITRFKFDRFNDGAEKVSIKAYQNGSLISTYADRAWSSPANGIFRVRMEGTGRKFDFKHFKAALQ